MAAEIFVFRAPATLKYAENLGTAFQLTNITRDVGKDPRRGRVYLPLDELARFGLSATDIVHLNDSEKLQRLMQFQIERAEQYYGQAFASLPAEDRKSQRPGLVMAAIYQTVLREIRNGGWQGLYPRTSLSPVRQIWLAPRG